MTDYCSQFEILILSYNRKNYLESALKSALNQTVKNIKVTVVDNCSNQDVVDLIENYQNNYPNLNLYRQKEHVSVYENSKTAINLANAPYMIMMHDDDILHPQYAESILGILSKQENVSLIAPIPFKMFDEDKLEIKTYNTIKYRLYSSQDFLKKYFIHRMNDVPIYPSITYKTELFKKSLDNPHVDKAGPIGDNITIAESIGNGNVIIIDCPLYYYRIHPSQESHILKMHKSEYLAFLEYFKKKLNINTYTKKIYEIFSYYRLRKLHNSYQLTDAGNEELFFDAYEQHLINKWNYLLLSDKVFKFFIQPFNHIRKKIYQNVKYKKEILTLEDN